MQSMIVIAIALAVSTAPDTYDRLFLNDGETIEGTVLENTRGKPLLIVLPDGSTREIPRETVARIRWAGDATFEVVEDATSSPEPEKETVAPPLRGGWTSYWFAIASPRGTLDPAGSAVADAYGRQFEFSWEPAMLVSRQVDLGLYLTGALGSAKLADESRCVQNDPACKVAVGLHTGLFVAKRFAPSPSVIPWLQIGGGVEYLAPVKFAADHEGWELTGHAGIDFLRDGGDGGFGLFAGGRWGAYRSASAAHGWLEAGVRFTTWGWGLEPPQQ